MTGGRLLELYISVTAAGVLWENKYVWACLETNPPPDHIDTMSTHTHTHTQTHIHVHAHTCTHLHIVYIYSIPCICGSRILYGRETDSNRKSPGQGRAGQSVRCRANNPETWINPYPVGGSPMPILHEPVHTILSQPCGLWDTLTQLIGFAGRLCFGW
jgi:hypothetical protein